MKIAAIRFLPIAANAIMPASIGVEQGVPASANTIPKRIGYKNNEFVEFTGMALIIIGISKSSKPVIFSPITNNKDAMISVKYPPRADANTLPVIAQIIPIIEKTIAVPIMKKHSCMKVLSGVSFE